MIYLLLCILSSSGIMVVFKLAGIKKLDTFKIIIINYFTAALLGFAIGGLPTISDLTADWMPMVVIIGILFIVIFFVIAITTQRSGIAVATVAAKMSVVIPISFSLLYFHEEISIAKMAGIGLALVSVFLTVYRKEAKQQRVAALLSLPLVLFLGAGLIDSLIKYTQEAFLSGATTIVFSSLLFTCAGITGIVISFFKKNSNSADNLKGTVLFGVILGIINFGSLFGLIKALSSNVFDSSILFGINNMGIVVLSVLIAMIFFKEKLSKLNILGIALSIITIILLSYI